MKINLHIDRLVLNGLDFTSDQQHLLQTSAVNELTRLLSEGGLAPHLAGGIALARLSAGDIQVTGNCPAQLGRQIAQSV
ncbi:MAG: hypothetical protein KDK05_29930, partial [Candidatus Competibacteraceae bacterium]|nr:hypothetical protein [Candidatus Competibacteraceae bacterium]